MSIHVCWDSKFEVGHPRIDFEHRIFLDLIAELSRQAEGGTLPSRLAKALCEIYKYADFHFVSEENLMEDIGYPDLAEHRQQHEMLLAELRDFRAELDDGGRPPAKIVNFLFQWFALHTSREDKRIADFIRASNAQGA